MLIVIAVAVLLGLRHATDPDHLAAVTTLVTNGRGGATRLGLTWGLGHASSLLVARRADRALEGLSPAARRAERRGDDRIRDHGAGALAARCAGGAARSPTTTHICASRRAARRGRRTASASCTGSAAVAASAYCCSRRSTSHVVALVALVLFAACTASRWRSSRRGSAYALGRPRPGAPSHGSSRSFGAIGVCFGTWYALGALALVPYVF